MKQLSTLLLLGVLLGTLGVGLIASAQSPQRDRLREQPPLHEHPTLQAMLRESNALRASVGLPPQTMCPELCQAAQFHALYMARTGEFRHDVNLGLSGRAKKFGYQDSLFENIARGQVSIREVFQDWRDSPGHWKAIISESEVAGFGYTISDDGEAYWVSMYGRTAQMTR